MTSSAIGERGARTAAIVVAAAALGAQWASVALAPRGDLPNHVRWAERLAEGQWLYAGGANLPYLPFWAVAHLPLSSVGPERAPLVAYPLGVAALVALVVILDRLARPHWPLPPAVTFWSAAIALVLAGRFVVRDLFDGGPNTVVLALAWLGLLLWVRRSAWAAAPLGLAIALKLTPLVYLAYLLARRQWRTAAATAAVAAGLTLVPIAWLGARSFADHLRAWGTFVASGLVRGEAAVGVLGPDSVLDISLRPALARLAAAVDVDASGWALRGLVVALVLGVAWALRRPAAPPEPGTLHELAALAILGVLVSPIAWRQHAVASLPAFYLLVREALARRRLDAIAAGVLGAHLLLVVVLNRAVAGRETTLLLHQLSVHTWSLLAVLALVLRGPAR